MIQEQLEALLKRREKVSAAVQKAKGKQESAKEALAELEQECRERGVDPDRLEEFIEKLQKKADKLFKKLESDIALAEKQIAPLLGEENAD